MFYFAAFYSSYSYSPPIPFSFSFHSIFSDLFAWFDLSFSSDLDVDLVDLVDLVRVNGQGKKEREIGTPETRKN